MRSLLRSIARPPCRGHGSFSPFSQSRCYTNWRPAPAPPRRTLRALQPVSRPRGPGRVLSGPLCHRPAAAPGRHPPGLWRSTRLQSGTSQTDSWGSDRLKSTVARQGRRVDTSGAGRAEFSGRSRMRTAAVTAAASLARRFSTGRQEITGPPTLDQRSSMDRGPATPCLSSGTPDSLARGTGRFRRCGSLLRFFLPSEKKSLYFSRLIRLYSRSDTSDFSCGHREKCE